MMLSKLIEVALSQRLMTVLVAAVLLGFGVKAMRDLPIDAFPDISPTQVKIIVKSPGMTPEEVETLITQPLEVELLGIPEQSMLRSISKYALSSITLDFNEGTDIYWARQQVAERVNNVWNDLPGDISGGLAPMSTPLGDMFMFTIDNPDLSNSEKRFLLDWTIRPALRTVPGVADVNSLGGFVKTFQVAPKREAMALLGFNNNDITVALRSNNRSDGAGRIDQGEEAILVRVNGAIQSLDDLRKIQITNVDQKTVSLDQIANVNIGSLECYGSVTADGDSEAVQGLVIGLRGANAREVVNGVQTKLDELENTLPDGTRINVFYDRSVLINSAVSTVSKALIEAVILVLILLGLFLGNIRAAITVATVLPLSALATFLLMGKMNMTANLMSLGGLVIAIGILVDSSIVIVENIVASLGRNAHNKLPRLHIIYRAVKEVSIPVTSGVAIIVIVFLPLLSLEGLEGKLFGPVTLTIVFALVSALFLSLSVIPVLASYLINRQEDIEPWLSRKLHELYEPLLIKALTMPKTVLVSAGILLLSAACTFPFIGKTFMPTMDEGDIIIQLEFIPSINLSTTTRMVQQVEKALLDNIQEIERVVSRSGSDEIGMDPMGLNETDMFLQLKPTDAWHVRDKAELEENIRTVMESFKGINFGFTQPIDMRVSEMLTGSRGDVAIKLFGTDLHLLNDYAQRIQKIVSQVPGSVDAMATLNEGAQFLQVNINRTRAGQLGVDADQLQRQLRSEIEGMQVGTIIDEGARVPLVLRYDKLQGDGQMKLNNDFINLPDGSIIPLSELAEIQRVEGPVSISRESGQRFATIRSNVEGRDLVGFVAEAQQTINEQLKLPEGYSLSWGGEFENQQRAATRLSIVVPVAIALIGLLLFLTFNSIKQTLVILSNIPFAMIGGIFALFVTGQYLSVPASVGFIALLGIAVLNGVVMMSHFNYLHAKRIPIEEVVREGALRRLRPVLMTASTCAFGLVPLLIAEGPGSEIQKPLAIVVIGGLISSTLLTLFLLPIVYRYTHRYPV
ncbi:efflux RND transporter permease subunit [Aurantivibrio plasticivorans]